MLRDDFYLGHPFFLTVSGPLIHPSAYLTILYVLIFSSSSGDRALRASCCESTQTPMDAPHGTSPASMSRDMCENQGRFMSGPLPPLTLNNFVVLSRALADFLFIYAFE